MKPKDAAGNYFAEYVLNHSPAGTDPVLWSEAVREQIRRAGVTDITPYTTLANTDWPEIRRIHNRLLGEGKQRRNADSHPAPAEPFEVGTARGPKARGAKTGVAR